MILELESKEEMLNKHHHLIKIFVLPTILEFRVEVDYKIYRRKFNHLFFYTIVSHHACWGPEL